MQPQPNISGESQALVTMRPMTRKKMCIRDRLMEEKIFASVDYTGYSQNQDGDWSVKVNCTMAPVQQEVAEE